MGLKYKIAKLEDVPENVRPMYRLEGTEFVLDAEGVVPKERLDEFRTNNIQLQEQLNKLKDIDPVKYKELTVLQRKLEEKELIDKGELDKVVNLRVDAMNHEFTTVKTALESRLQAADAQLNMLLVDNVVKTAAIKQGVIAEAVDDVVLRAKGTYTVVDGVPTPKNAKGEVIYGKDGKTPMPVEEWLQELKKTAKHLFMGSSGSGAGGGNRGGTQNTTNLTPAQKISLGLNQGGLVGKLPVES